MSSTEGGECGRSEEEDEDKGDGDEAIEKVAASLNSHGGTVEFKARRRGRCCCQ